MLKKTKKVCSKTMRAKKSQYFNSVKTEKTNEKPSFKT